MALTAGQQLALRQLEDICKYSEHEVMIADIVEPTEDRPSLKLRISLATRHHEKTKDGLPLRKREPLWLYIPSKFPRDYPSVYAVHSRFAGYPHVQWGTYLCMYRAPDVEWAPKDGMYGFIERLNKWFGAAARNELDPDDAPLHPPVVYNQSLSDFTIVIRENVPAEAEGAFWLGTAALRNIHKSRYDLFGWNKKIDEIGEGNLGAAAVLLNQPFPIEYPKKVNALVDELNRHGIDFGSLYLILKFHVLALPQDQPLFVVLGTPMRRRDPNGPLRHHLAIWKVDDEAVQALRALIARTEDQDESIKEFVKWSLSANVTWTHVDEAREEVTIGRDAKSQIAWVRDKNVLLLGCGALGSHTAEYLVRAGVGRLTLVDNDIVSSGVLTRQQYSDADVGRLKSYACRDNLQAIAPDCDIAASLENLKYGVLAKFGREFDLIIDATASRAVADAIEEELRADPVAPPLLAMSVSAKAEIGRLIVRPSQAFGGHKTVIRNAQLKSYANPQYADLARAFWPRPNEVELFQPEPGCSEPTFQGSAADMACHASGLLNLGLVELAKGDPTSTLAAFAPQSTGGASNRRYLFEKPTLHTELNHGYSVLCSPEAERTLMSEVARSARVNGDEVETGGLLFGEIDEGLGQLWIDKVTGPPPDSHLSPELFVCGTEGTQERADLEKRLSGGASRFVGIWHTHPVSPPRPSTIDLGAMLSILIESETPPRHTVMLIVGHA
jgi:molybdopterin/thiamine biosynthesis adenylyltransferase/proteasome lid subunit RPN8/RPN11